MAQIQKTWLHGLEEAVTVAEKLRDRKIVQAQALDVQMTEMQKKARGLKSNIDELAHQHRKVMATILPMGSIAKPVASTR